MKRISLAATLAFTCAITGLSAVQDPQAGAAATGPSAGGDDKKVTLTGCVVKGDDGFLLSDAVAASTTSTTTVAPTPTGVTATTTTTTTPGKATMLYWLDGNDELNAHSGHRVEVTGEVKGDVDAAEIKVERENNAVKITAKSGDRKVSAMLPEVPAAVGTAGAVGDKDKKIEMPYGVRKLDVKSVKMIAENCR
jgi:uncharacterized protein YdeI (BOF family)